MNNELYKTVKRALDEADADYIDDEIECGEIPDRAGELLKHRLGCDGQHVSWQAFYYDKDGDSIHDIICNTIDFCRTHSDITSYTIVDYKNQEFLFVVYITK